MKTKEKMRKAQNSGRFKSGHVGYNKGKRLKEKLAKENPKKVKKWKKKWRDKNKDKSREYTKKWRKELDRYKAQGLDITMHSDFYATLCPGRHLKNWLKIYKGR